MNFRHLMSLLASTLVFAAVSANAAADDMSGHQASAPEWTDADSNRDGYLSKEELVPYPTLGQDFARIDTNSDGKLSKDEYVSWMSMDHDMRKDDKH
ncbi:hypothetical protein [Dokdonella immobilis]|uniref:EF hand n=1 Tax=Dokdonella immobilis TaxID=578942 RepID=A0A1I4ZNA4_9GAMM|nr:hypothetical protein [Dokdonella immobilis]SFN51668.1 EF hand [Dokdonella immobilis]